jgi:hypothetical protein
MIRIKGFDDQKLKSQGLPKGRPSYRRSLYLALKKEHPALQNMKIIFFSIFVGNFCPPGSGSAV